MIEPTDENAINALTYWFGERKFTAQYIADMRAILRADRACVEQQLEQDAVGTVYPAGKGSNGKPRYEAYFRGNLDLPGSANLFLHPAPKEQS